MILLSYVTVSLPWTGFGLIVGFLLGARARRELTTKETDMTEVPRRRRVTGLRILGAVVVLLSVASAVQGLVQSRRTDDLARCQLAYSTGFADALDARSKASQSAQDALDDWMTKVNDIIQAPTPEARTKILDAFHGYLAARQQAKDTQRINPYPSPPRDVCPNAAR